MFDPVDPKQSFPDLEEGILEYWKYEDTFKRSIHHRKGGEAYSFYDGPPFATGLPHYGHILAGTIKDVIPRYQTMQGKCVQRRFGWDCHGLPIENLVEQEEGIKNKREIEERGVRWFNDKCRGSVQRYTKEWRKTVERMGRWVDMDWDYRTMDPQYMESMWWAFQELWKKELIYEGHKSMHICPRCSTPLSNFEVTQAYADRTDMSVIVTFPLQEDPKTVLLAWTTTPWSLPGNVWLLVGPHITYVLVKAGDTTYVVAKNLVKKVFGDRVYEIGPEVNAGEFVGRKYEPLFPYFVDTVMPSTAKAGRPQTYGERCFQVLLDEHGEVSEEEGTGIVHLTTSHGEDGFEIAKKLGVDILHHLNMDGSFKPAVVDFAGLNAKPEGADPMSTDKKVIAKLKEMGRHFASEPYTHSYPHCWRCDTPLLNYAASSWFVAVERLKNAMLRNNANTTWVPAHIRDGRYGKWLTDARDWAISRSRYWGTPLPIWRVQGVRGGQGVRGDDDDIVVIGSRDELMSKCKIRFTKVTVLRHGESEGNITKVYQGQEPGTDLTENGRRQAQWAGQMLAKNPKKCSIFHFPFSIGSKEEEPLQPVRAVYTSPLTRTQQTAQLIVGSTGAPIIVDDRIREVSFGEHEGKHVDFSDLAFVRARRAHKFEEGKPESIYHLAGMEGWKEVGERITAFLTEILPRHRGEHIVLVTHADPLKNIQHFFTREDPFKLSHQPYPGYAEPYTFFWDHEREAQLDLHKDTVDEIVWGSGSDVGSETVKVTLARHGQTDWNREGNIAGWKEDVPLNAKGKEQALELAKKLQGQPFDAVVSSDLARARETAEIVSRALGLLFEEEWQECRERDTGTYEGRTLQEVYAENPALGDPTFGINFHYAMPPGGESFASLISRACEVRDRLLTQYAGRRVLLVGHSGFNRALFTVVKNLTYPEGLQMRPDNTELQSLTIVPLLRRVPEVVDCWFESGSMPYAQQHFPFENQKPKTKNQKHEMPEGFPADFIAEGIDQTRTWFYTLMVLSTALFGETPFKHVVVNGIVLADDGKKMSKRLKNYPEPMEIVEKYGADAIRFTLMSSPAVRGEDLRISEKLIEASMRNVLLPLWNAYSFFVLHANEAGWKERRVERDVMLSRAERASTRSGAEQRLSPRESKHESKHPLDRWILAEVQDLVNRMTEQMDRYDLSATCAELHETIDALTNWYIRLSRRRFSGKNDEQGEGAFHTLYSALLTLCKLLCPFCPFLPEAIYLNLASQEHGSVHFTDWPEARTLTHAEQMLIRKTRLQRLIVSLGLSVRAQRSVKVRQPLASAIVAIPPAVTHDVVLDEGDLRCIKQELNVKDLTLTGDPGALAEAYAHVDARKVGPRLGAKVQEIIRAGKEGKFTKRDDGSVEILGEVLSSDEVAVIYRGVEGRAVASERGVVVSVDTVLTDSLKLEGLAREIIRSIQIFRKEKGLKVSDRIVLEGDAGVEPVLRTHQSLIESETNGKFGGDPQAALHVTVGVENEEVVVNC